MRKVAVVALVGNLVFVDRSDCFGTEPVEVALGEVGMLVELD